MHDSLLSSLSIGQLAEVVEGRLQLGCMPPLGGSLEPTGRIVVDASRVQPGDLFWGLQQGDVNHSRNAEAAYVHDAAGAVVCGRRLEPWAGKYCIEVADTRLALWQLAMHVRRIFTGPVIALLGEETADTNRWIKSVVGDDGELSERGWHPDFSVRLPLELLELMEEDRAAVIPLASADPEEFSLISHLCDPEIVVINSTRHADDRSFERTAGESVEAKQTSLERWCDSVNSASQMLVIETIKPRQAGDQHQEIQVIAKSGDATRTAAAKNVRTDNGLQFELDGVTWSVPGSDSKDLAAIVASCEVGRLLGMTDRRISNALQREGCRRLAGPERTPQSRTKNHKGITEASPTALDLRESNAALPPGLERFAY